MRIVVACGISGQQKEIMAMRILRMLCYDFRVSSDHFSLSFVAEVSYIVIIRILQFTRWVVLDDASQLDELQRIVWRKKHVLKPTPGKLSNCRNVVYYRQIGVDMLQQMKEQVCDECPNVKYKREGSFITVDIEKGMKDGQVSYTVDLHLLIQC
ncbi:hypothetical protein Nepgr_002300 [Nepenthes gracilis]|uniref:Uncharacterized protein n=1 Tax=Nepenthes gracilis TaxID=150966 RepID=A0AAD3P606_NEPGR|nr:hypothetical protein Nepgr_002300 [Nepenthes gracilis]